MLHDDLGEQRPSEDEKFADRVLDMLKATETGDVSKVQQLLADDPRLASAKGEHDKSALHVAAEKNHQEIADILIAAGADIEQLTTWGMTPLEWAANMGNRAVACSLLQKGAKLNMWVAAGLGMLENVRLYFQADRTLREGAAQTRKRRDENGQWVTVPPPTDAVEIISDAFYIACRNGHVNVAELLLDKGAQINFRGFFAAPGLHWAAINGHRPMVEFLVEHGADMHIEDAEFNSDALGWAAEAEQMAVVEFLESKGARLTLGRAAQLGRLDWVRSSLEIDPALLNTVMGYGTPLHQATLWGRLPVVEFLLAQGADPNVKNCNGETALTICLKALQGKTAPRKSEYQQHIAELLRLHGGVES